MKEFLEELKFPQEAAVELLRWASRLGPQEELLNPETSQQAATALRKELSDQSPDGMAELAVHLLTAKKSRPHWCESLALPDRVFLDTMGCFPRFLLENYSNTGRYFYDRGFWTWRQLCGRLFRLGVLEFEIVPEGLSVHIPSDAVCTREALHASYDAARKLFGDDCRMYCETWLLSPALPKLLKPDSGILTFQRDYEVYKTDEQNEDYKRWVFGNPEGPMEQWPEATSLQRGVKAYVLQGGKIGCGTGWLKK